MKRKFILLPITITAFTPEISLVGCGNPNTPEPIPDITKELDQDKSSSRNGPMTETTAFDVELNKSYRFNVDASICLPESFIWCSEELVTFMIYKEEKGPSQKLDISITRLKVGKIIFEPVERIADLVFGKYFFDKSVLKLYIHNGSIPDSSFTMSVDLTFPDNDGESVIARWYSDI